MGTLEQVDIEAGEDLFKVREASIEFYFRGVGLVGGVVEGRIWGSGVLGALIGRGGFFGQLEENVGVELLGLASCWRRKRTT